MPLPTLARCAASLALAALLAVSAHAAPLRLSVDATDLDHRRVRVQELVPVQPGPLKLYYPRWIPGWHGPGGNITLLSGLEIRAGGQRLAWQRDPVETESLHLVVPDGVSELAISFQHLAPINGLGGRVTMSRNILNLDWFTLLLYPAGTPLSAQRAVASVSLPAGFEAGTALRPTARRGNTLDFAEVSLETLIDSPLFAGRHHRRIELEPPGAARPVALELFAEEPDQLEFSAAQMEAHRALVRQADRLFGARHFAHYDLLLLQSKQIGGVGLEHHESSENGVMPGYFKDWDKGMRERQLLPHEYTHSWNGKFRRPADLWTPDLNALPMRTSLLWVYEGQTEYWGRVLASRAGLVTPEQARDQLARTAAYRQGLSGRAWRSLQDTTADPLLDALGKPAWPDMQRSGDYYDESTLIWLDVDTLIRELSGNQRSLDDFARAFFGVEEGRVAPLTYSFEQVVAALNAVQPFDWARLLRERLDRTGDAGGLLNGLTRSGWRLDFDEQESEAARNAHDETDDGPNQSLEWSVGLVLDKNGKALRVLWDGPAFRAGVAPGQQVMAVQGLEYKPERLAAAITAAKGAGPAVELLLKDGERFWTAKLDHHGGLRYPKLVRLDGVPDRLSAILAPK